MSSIKCFFKTYHEYRYALALAVFSGAMTGSTDALVNDFTVKAFIWSAVIVASSMLISYEFIVMPAPEKPKLQAVLFVILWIAGFLSTHHFTWMALMLMLGCKIENPLWLAPNIYSDPVAYTIAMLVLIIFYTLYVLYTNTCSYEEF